MTTRWTGNTAAAQLEFHERRPIRPSFSWLDVTSYERAHFFTVAKAADPELLTTFKHSITEALIEGHGFSSWQKLVLPKLAAIGWDRPRLVVDPRGQRQPELVDFTNPVRLKSILWANRRLAQMAAEWAAIERTGIGLPYVLYIGAPPAYSCPTHQHWAGTLLPVHHSWWRKHCPPNGWGCECRLLQYTRKGRDRLIAGGRSPTGFPYRTEPPEDGPPTIFVNKRIGRSLEIPRGLEFGWDGNPTLDAER